MSSNNTQRFEGKVAFVTGATSGIGQGTALAFAREGASGVVVDIAEEGVQKTARLIEEAGGKALSIKCDVSKADEVEAAVAKAVETFGGIDLAFNNAGL